MTSEKDLSEKLVRIIDWSRGPRTGTHTVAWQLYSDAARAAIAAMLRENH